MRSPSSSSSSTTTASGSSTRALTRNSRSSVIRADRLAAGSLDALGPQQGRDRLRRLVTVLEPVARALLVDVDRRGLGLRVVLADRLDRPTVTRGAFVGDDDAPDRVLLRTHPSKSDSDCHRAGQISVFAPSGAARAGCHPPAWPSAGGSASGRWPSISSALSSGQTASRPG